MCCCKHCNCIRTGTAFKIPFVKCLKHALSSPDMIVRAAFVLGSALELQEDGRLAAGDLDGTDILCRYGRHCVLFYKPLTPL